MEIDILRYVGILNQPLGAMSFGYLTCLVGIMRMGKKDDTIRRDVIRACVNLSGLFMLLVTLLIITNTTNFG